MAAGTVGLAATAVLTACGFNYPTDRINNITAGVNDRSGTVEVLNAAVVAQADNSGTLIATFVNNSNTKKATLQSVNGDGTTVSQVTGPPLAIDPSGLVNLADTGGFAVTGTFKVGQFVNLTMQFSNGQTSTIDVPVVADSGQWAGLDTASQSPSGSPSGTPSASGSPVTPSPTGSATPTPTDAAS
jgi:hypothetical protein